MSYHNYRDGKQKGLVNLNKKISIEKIVSEGTVKEEERISFELEIKKFSEKDGSEFPHPERNELDIEALEKEKILLQGFIEDINEILVDIEALKE